MLSGMTVKKTVRLSAAAAHMVAGAAQRSGTSEADIMAEAIDDYLMQLACEHLDQWSQQADRSALIARWRTEDASE